MLEKEGDVRVERIVARSGAQNGAAAPPRDIRLAELTPLFLSRRKQSAALFPLMVSLEELAGMSPALQGFIYLKILPLFKYLLYIRIALLITVLLSGFAVSWLYNQEGKTASDKANIRYTWQTWFGDVGLWSIIINLLSAIVLTLVIRAITARVQSNLPAAIKKLPSGVQTTIGAGTGMTVREQIASHLVPAFESLEFE